MQCLKVRLPGLWVPDAAICAHCMAPPTSRAGRRCRRRLPAAHRTPPHCSPAAQVASAVTRACQVPRGAAVAQRAAQLQSVARVSGAASLRRQQGAGMGAAARLSVVRAMATANGPVTKKVFFDIEIGGQPAGRITIGLYGGEAVLHVRFAVFRPVRLQQHACHVPPCAAVHLPPSRPEHHLGGPCHLLRLQMRCPRPRRTSVPCALARWASATRVGHGPGAAVGRAGHHAHEGGMKPR